MTFAQWMLYTLVVVAIIATPGPSALLCMTHGATHGYRRTLATVMGGMSASVCLMLLSSLGLGAVVASSSEAFLVIKWVGALYLVYLGIRTWRSASEVSGESEVVVPRRGGLFATGFMVGISNPKDLLFFGAFFPQFINPQLPIMSQLLTLGLTWVVLDIFFMSSYGLVGQRFAGWGRRLGAGRWFKRLSGGAFVVAGGALVSANK